MTYNNLRKTFKFNVYDDDDVDDYYDERLYKIFFLYLRFFWIFHR